MKMIVSHWSANAAALLACAALAAAYLAGILGGRAADGPRPRWAEQAGRPRAARLALEVAAFHLGLLTVVAALISPIGYWAQRYIWVRSVQDLLLAVVAPALIVLGAPWLPLARSVGLRAAGPAADRRPPARAGRARICRPVVVAVAFNAAWWAWHLPVPYDAALRHPLVYAAQVVTYLGLGAAFWLQLIGSRPFTPDFDPLRRVGLVAGTIVSGTVLAMGLVFGSSLLYPAYLGPAHRVFGVVADQQVGGAVLWVLLVPPYLVAAVALLAQWLAEEESDARAVDLDRLLTPSRSGWHSRPGLR